jgi:selenide, water dikinase
VLDGLAEADGLASGIATRDDAGYLPLDGRLLLQSVDFFTPIVDDPHRFGQIAAANALSDIYAMGGEPLAALNLVAWPCSLDVGALREVLSGGLQKVREAGAALLGGHSVQDDEPKYGLSVTGSVEPERLVRNAGARPGDRLVLTKPLGLGILTTALKRELAADTDIEEAVEAAARLNREACAAVREVAVSAATDVTGFGLLGHLAEMLAASEVGAVVRRGAVPVWDGVPALAAEGCYPGGLDSNREHLVERVVADGVAEADLLPLYDPQTSGGLLIAVPEASLGELRAALAGRGERAEVVGEVLAGAGVRVTP